MSRTSVPQRGSNERDHRGEVTSSRGPATSGTLEALQRSAGNRAVSTVLQRQDDEAASDQVRAVLRAGGVPLEAGFRARAERFLGADLSHVRVHASMAAAESARAVGARAYTSGSDIVFGSGQYDTRSAAGQQRLAHELTHVAQQQRGPVAGSTTAGGLTISDPSDRFEREADRLGTAFTSEPPVTLATPDGCTIQREFNDGNEIPHRPFAHYPSELVIQRKNINQALGAIKRPALQQGSQKRTLRRQVPDPKDPSKQITESKVVTVPANRSIVQSPGAAPQAARLYTQAASQVAGSKVKALQSAATHNAEVGKNADFYAKWAHLDATPNSKWTRNTKYFNKDGVKSLDPFFYQIVVKFQADGSEQVLALIYQHAASYTGYVECIYDSSNEATRDRPSMRDIDETEATAKADKNYRNPKFTNIHDVGGKQGKIIDITYGKQAKSFDAYTKIAGEGARWRCVRNHSANLRDDSIFFVHDPSYQQEVYGVTFRQLWLSWARVFKKKYDITDEEVGNALRADQLFPDSTHYDKTVLNTADYDLDNCMSYTPAPQKVLPNPTSHQTPVPSKKQRRKPRSGRK